MSIKEKINSLSAEKLLVIKNIFYSGFGQAINYLIPLFILPIIAKRIGLEQLGQYSIAQTIFGYTALTIGFGFTLSTVRYVTSAPNNEKLSELQTSIFFAKVFNAVVSIALCLVALHLYPSLMVHYNWVAGSIIVYALGLVLYQDWLLVGLQKAGYQFTALLISRLIYLYFVFFTNFANSLEHIIFLEAVVSLFVGVVTLVQIYYLSTIKIYFFALNVEAVKNIWKEGLIAFSSYFFVYLYSSVNILIFGLIGSKEELGLYSFIDRVYLIFMGGFAIVLRSLFPYLSKIYAIDVRKYYYITIRILKNLFLFLLLVLSFLFLSKDFVFQITTRGVVDADKMPLLSKVFATTLIAILLHTCSSFLSYTFYINHTEKRLFKILAIVAFVNLILSYPVLFYLGVLGIPTLLIINYSICFTLQLFYFYKSNKI